MGETLRTQCNNKALPTSSKPHNNNPRIILTAKTRTPSSNKARKQTKTRSLKPLLRTKQASSTNPRNNWLNKAQEQEGIHKTRVRPSFSKVKAGTSRALSSRGFSRTKGSHWRGRGTRRTASRGKTVSIGNKTDATFITLIPTSRRISKAIAEGSFKRTRITPNNQTITVKEIEATARTTVPRMWRSISRGMGRVILMEASLRMHKMEGHKTLTIIIRTHS